jgi:hypothetical protein
MLMVRASAEGKEGRFIRDELVTRLWEDNTERIRLLAVRTKPITLNLIAASIIHNASSFFIFILTANSQQRSKNGIKRTESNVHGVNPFLR